MKNFKRTTLISGIATSMVMSMSASVMASQKDIGDLSIYKAAESDAPTLTFMLDRSGSMGKNKISLKKDYDVTCYPAYKSNIIDDKVYSYTDPNDASNTFSVTMDLAGCAVDKLDRLSILKDSLLTLLTVPGQIDDDTRLALGVYGVKKGLAGKIVLEARKLDFQHRKDLANAIKGIKASGATPTASALAEAGAYMMGTNTIISEELPWQVIAEVINGLDYSGNTSISKICKRWSEVRNVNRTITLASTAQQTITTVRDCVEFESPYAGNASFDPNLEADGSTTDANGLVTLYTKAVTPVDAEFYSGTSLSVATSKTSDQSRYVQGAKASQCAGNGIYLLTDGEPSPISTTIAKGIMSKSLEHLGGAAANNTKVENCNSLSGSGGWGCIGDYAKLLRANDNPSGLKIKLATVGLGAGFAGLPKKEDSTSIEDCDGAATTGTVSYHVRNLCKLGEEGYGLGEGGFTHATTSDDISKSILDFLAKLNDVISTTPSGTITIPLDPLSSTNIQPYAYLPMLEPKVAETRMIWPGNLKKYHVKVGTLFGKDDKRLYVKPEATANQTDTGNFPFMLNKEAKDIWMANDANYEINKLDEDNNPVLDSGGNNVKVIRNDSVQAGGVYARLSAPNDDVDSYSIRSIYVEDIKLSDATKTRLVKVGVAAGTATEPHTLIGFDDLLDPAYTIVAKAYLLNMLGYNVSTDASLYDGTTDADKKAQLIAQIKVPKPATEIKVLGGVVHSKPVLVSYGGEFNPVDKDTDGDGNIDDDAGQITNDESKRADHLLFGSMDGALHLVEARTGKENYAVIPLKMIKEQVAALRKDETGRPIGTPQFGVDAPWAQVAEYVINFADEKISATSVAAYGGLRMGGIGMYGLNLTSDTMPSVLFSIERGGDFSRLGQTWSKPLVTRIKTGSGSDDTQDVVIFGGGYDMCYEDPNFSVNTSTTGGTTSSTTDVCDDKSETYGNAVYMVDATTGELVASWSGVAESGNNTLKQDMKDSVVGGITGLDRNDNGTIDHLYFSDLGGKVFRIDLQEGKTGTDMTKRIVKLFDANKNTGISAHIPFRFYERPIAIFYDMPGGSRFAAINIASGDRSSPLHTERSLEDANRVYSVFDHDIAHQGLFGNIALISQDLTSSELAGLPFDTITGNPSREDIIEKMRTPETPVGGAATNDRSTYTYDGWYYPLTRFDGYGEVEHVKAMGEGMLLSDFYYMTTYNPNMKYGESSTCAAQIMGGSERQLYCMPYGICTQKDGNDYISANGTGGYTRGGTGIQELAVGSVSADKRTSRLVLGNQTIAEQLAASNRNNSNEGNSDTLSKISLQANADGTENNLIATGGDVTAALPIISEGFKVVPQRWYELQSN